jgi:hypothetical protein
MQKRFTLSMAIVLLLGLIPATAAAALPRTPYVGAGAWTLTREELPDTARLSAWDINWRVTQPAIIELGYLQFRAGGSERVVEVTIAVNQSEKYPQHLHLAGETRHRLVPGDCESMQLLTLRERDGTIRVIAPSPVTNICIER